MSNFHVSKCIFVVNIIYYNELDLVLNSTLIWLICGSAGTETEMLRGYILVIIIERCKVPASISEL